MASPAAWETRKRQHGSPAGCGRLAAAPITVTLDALAAAAERTLAALAGSKCQQAGSLTGCGRSERGPVDKRSFYVKVYFYFCIEKKIII